MQQAAERLNRVDPAAIAEEARTVRLDAVLGPPRKGRGIEAGEGRHMHNELERELDQRAGIGALQVGQ